MKKTLLAALFAAFTSFSAYAQFEVDKVYISGALSGFNLNYCGSKDFTLNIDAKAGYMVEDNWMVLGQTSYSHSGLKGVSDAISAGVGGRYYIQQNGLFIGAGVKYLHAKHFDDFMPGVELGYAYFISRTVTVEPSLYYDQSFKNHADYSTIGFRIGVGIYL